MNMPPFPRRPVLPLVALCLALAAPAFAAEPATVAVTQLQRQRAQIETAPLQAATAATTSEARLDGRAVAPASAQTVVSTPLAGVLQSVEAEPLQALSRGALLARVASPDLLAHQRELRSAALEARLAADKLKRDQSLFADGLIAESRLHETRAAEQRASAALDEQRAALRLAGLSPAAIEQGAGGALSPALELRAPEAATLVEWLAQPGQHLEAGAPVVRLVRSGRLLLELQATPAQAASIAPGASVRVDGCAAAGRITGSAPQLSAGAQTVLLRADLPDAARCLRLNQYVSATVATGGAAAAGGGARFQIPSSAIARSDNRIVVFVERPGGFVPAEVEILSQSADTALVRGAALAPGQQVVVKGTVAIKGIWLGLGHE
ncbi:efflux RND transporter periplasmic adaptor subunit [Derxia lacustris]|uniref:efflux RND transporter periplasmic adaptor subunit n=1 Tax=Derxia lacustris TaxID=764842 RepID=UPI000A172CB7|nr:efflux RND transporter periplasmic adaptor subunit [Derxia lacustris]